MQDTSAADNVPVDPADAASRLEAALDRIARVAPRVRDADGAAASDSAAAPDSAASEVAARLDQLIAQLRGVLDGAGADGTQS